MNAGTKAVPFQAVESVLATDELARRNSRPPQHEAECGALRRIARTLADSPDAILQGLVDGVMDLCHAHSAGISILEDNDETPVFRWHAIAGRFSPNLLGTAPREFSPCGLVIDRDELVLFREPSRYYPYLSDMSPHIEEALLVPFHVGGRPIGTLWVLSHDASRRFDAEDARLLTSVANVAAASYQVVKAMRALAADSAARAEMHRELEQRNVELSLEIAERKRVADALRRSEQRLRLAMESTSLGTFEWQIQTDRVELSENIRRQFGLELAGHLTLSETLEHVHAEDRPTVTAAIQTALDPEGARVYYAEFRTTLPDGRIRWFDVRGVVIFDGQSKTPQCMVGISVDITHRKEKEIGLQNSAEALTRANRMKDEFMATLAHELRNPLTPIRNGLEILSLTGLANPTQRRACDVMGRQLRHLVRLVDDLLDISRITQGRLNLRRETVTLRRVIDSAVETILPQIEAAQHSLKIDVPEQTIYLDVDPVRIAQAVGNLLANSARYTPSGGAIELRARPEDGGVQISVHDTGIGIAPHMLSKVFEMFTQEVRAERQSEAGLGIGLSLTKALVAMHGGRVWAESEGVGKGSTFTIWIPTTRAGASDPSYPIGTAPAQVCKRRVLVVDDNLDAADSTASLLGLMGHEVHEARDGLQAVEAARVFEPDLILMDIGMPGVDGHEAARRIRALPLAKRPLIVAMTGWGQESERRRSREAGIDAHVVKPVEASTLARLLCDMLTEDTLA